MRERERESNIVTHTPFQTHFHFCENPLFDPPLEWTFFDLKKVQPKLCLISFYLNYVTFSLLSLSLSEWWTNVQLHFRIGNAFFSSSPFVVMERKGHDKKEEDLSKKLDQFHHHQHLITLFFFFSVFSLSPLFLILTSPSLSLLSRQEVCWVSFVLFPWLIHSSFHLPFFFLDNKRRAWEERVKEEEDARKRMGKVARKKVGRESKNESERTKKESKLTLWYETSFSLLNYECHCQDTDQELWRDNSWNCDGKTLFPRKKNDSTFQERRMMKLFPSFIFFFSSFSSLSSLFLVENFSSVSFRLLFLDVCDTQTNYNSNLFFCCEQRKCDMYWPKEGSESYGIITVKLLQEVVMATYILRTFTIRNSKVKKVTLIPLITIWLIGLITTWLIPLITTSLIGLITTSLIGLITTSLITQFSPVHFVQLLTEQVLLYLDCRCTENEREKHQEEKEKEERVKIEREEEESNQVKKSHQLEKVIDL